MSRYDSFLSFYGLVTVATEPKYQKTKTGQYQILFSVILSRDGMKTEKDRVRSEIFRCVAYEKTAMSIQRWATVGSKCVIRGMIRQYYGKTTTKTSWGGKQYKSRYSYINLQIEDAYFVSGKRREKEETVNNGVSVDAGLPDEFLLGVDDIMSGVESAQAADKDYVELPQNNDDGGMYTDTSLPEDDLTQFTEIDFNSPDNLLDDMGIDMPWE